MAPPPVQIASLLEGALAEIGHPDGELASRFASLVELVFSWSARINLTGHRNRESITRSLVLESLGLATVIPEADSLVDLGSGAGFPGLPIALLRPCCRVTLVDARERRHYFQRTAIRELSVRNAQAVLGRAEVLAPAPHAIVVARAVAPIRDVVAWMLRWLEPSGLAFVPLRSGTVPPHLKGIAQAGIRHYRVPLGGPEREVWVGRKDAAHRP